MIGDMSSGSIMRKSTSYSRSSLPLVTGLLIGMLISMLYIQYLDRGCYPVLGSQKSSSSKFSGKEKKDGSSAISTPAPAPVKPKASHFNYDFRPYFVYSELGFRYHIIVAIKTTEARLNSICIAINNTWVPDLPKVIFFTPYSKNNDFHEKYVHNLNLDVVQLPDIFEESPDSDFSFRILQYMKDHYINNYNWFMQIGDEAYVNAANLVSYLHSLNSSQDLYLGHPQEIQRSVYSSTGNKKTHHITHFCLEGSGIVLSRSLLQKLTPDLNSKGDFSAMLAKIIYETAELECEPYLNFDELFVVGRSSEYLSKDIKNKEKLQQALSLYPIHSTREMVEVHKYLVEQKLKFTYNTIHQYQKEIQDMQMKLPHGVPEKTLHWPVGYPAPFKPSSRFEVISWTYFDTKYLYGHSDVEPVTVPPPAYQKDYAYIMDTIKQAMDREGFVNYKLLNGYRRVDPQRGAEYIVDIAKEDTNKEYTNMKRIQLLRPFTKIESLPMPAATEQKGIHLVLPVLREEVHLYEKFLQMYKRVCLQTGENVVLLTVFINIRIGKFEGEEKEDPFMESKNLISRYKHSYMWAQLPWLQVGVKHSSPVLVMDIVSMKLPVHALIFLVNINTYFTTNFLNRCRVNAVSGVQVFFPIPFAEYDPQLVYKTKPKPTFVEIHRKNGFWDRDAKEVACFSNKDYKDMRMLKDDFLDENQPSDRTVLDIFSEARLQVFRALDAELRRTFQPFKCKKMKEFNVTLFHMCTDKASERRGSRAQLAQLLFKMEKPS